MDGSRLRALDAVYAAALDPRLWQVAMDDIAAVSGAVRTHMLHATTAGSAPYRTVVSGYDTHFLESFDSYYGKINAWGPAFAGGPVGKPQYADQMCAYDVLKRTEFYADWVRPQEDIIGGGGMVLARSPSQLLLFGGNIPRSVSDDLNDVWQRDLTLFGPAIRFAVETNTALLGLRLELLAKGQADNGADSAVFLLDQRGAVMFANARGHDLLSRGGPVSLGFGSRLEISDERAAAAVRRALQTGAYDPPALHPLPADSRTLRLFKLTERTAAALGVPPAGPGRRAAVVVTLTAARRGDDPAVAGMARNFGLTGAEADIAVALADGRTTAEIAEARNASVHTVRNQVKSALSKTGSRRQAELVALVERLRRT